jgi:hypothetical protein
MLGGRITGDAKDSPLTRFVQSGYEGTAWVDGMASERETDESERASHRGHRGHRGGIWGLGELPYSVTPELLQLLTPVKSPKGHGGGDLGFGRAPLFCNS